MTRLKDALEKAAHSQSEGDGAHAAQFSVPAHVVPDAWQFEEPAAPDRVTSAPGLPAVSEVAPLETLFPIESRPTEGTPEPPPPAVAPMPAIPSPVVFAPVAVPPALPLHAAPPLGVPTPGGSSARAQEELWRTYPFGDRALGKVVVGPNANAGLVEQYRRLGAALHHHQQQTGARTLMVTSAVASEGKTLTSTNLALTLSNSYQRRVLMIDADLRRPSLHRLLHLENAIGLSDCLRRPDVVARYQTVSPTLSVLTAGRAESDPMAGLTSETMRSLLAAAASQFDWVIVDTPPVALLPDANLLGAMIDSALIVIGASATPYPLVRRAVEAIGESRVLGVVLNRMAEADIVRAYNYYGYGQYAYGVMKRRGRKLMFWKRGHPQPPARVRVGGAEV